MSPISHFSNTMWEMGWKLSWFPFLISKFQYLTSEFSLPTSHFWNPTSPFWFVVWTILFSSNLSQLEVGSGKWEMGSKKWEMGSKKWDVGIHNNLDILEWEMGPREVGNGTQTRILIFKISSSVQYGIAYQIFWPFYSKIAFLWLFSQFLPNPIKTVNDLSDPIMQITVYKFYQISGWIGHCWAEVRSVPGSGAPPQEQAESQQGERGLWSRHRGSQEKGLIQEVGIQFTSFYPNHD